jgi:hypothetical protein
MDRSRRPHFGGLRRGYCKNSDCPTRNVFFEVKRDPKPDAPAVCPRCQHPLTLFHWCEEPVRRVAEMKLESNVLRRQNG